MGKDSKDKTSMLEEFRSAYEDWKDTLSEFEDDYKMKLGDQWSDAAKAKLRAEGRPVLSLNVTHKHVRVVTGYEKQNRSDIRVYPVEGADQEKADIYSEVIKWMMVQGGNAFAISEAFDNAVTCGLGWLYARMNYDNDPESGDIELMPVSPFRVVPDPEFTRLDLSDCNYIYMHGWFHRDTIKMMYPDYENKIGDVSESKSAGLIQEPQTEAKDHIRVIEKYYRVLEDAAFVIDLETNDVSEFHGDSKRLAYMKDMIAKAQAMENPEGTDFAPFANLDIIERKVSRIKLKTLVGDDLIVYDDYLPHGINAYPFVPYVAYYTPAFNDLTLRFQGIVRSIKDAQKERNKRRSQLLGAILKMTFSGWIYEKGAVDDPKLLEQSGSGKNIPINPGKRLEQARPPEIPNSLVQLDQLHAADMREQGMNPDLLGIMQDAGAAGITLQLRQKQGILTIQDVFDYLSQSKRVLGRLLIALINANYSVGKIERIIGRPVKPDFETSMDNSRYDCIVDETQNNATYRMSNFMVLASMRDKGIPVPDDLFVEASDLPQQYKERIVANIQKLQQPPPGAGNTGVVPGGPGGAPIGAMPEMPPVTQ